MTCGRPRRQAGDGRVGVRPTPPSSARSRGRRRVAAGRAARTGRVGRAVPSAELASSRRGTGREERRHARGRPAPGPAGRPAPRAPAPRPGSDSRDDGRDLVAVAPAGPGSTTTNDEPEPGTDATSSSPPIARARSRAIGSPRPVPVTPSWRGQALEALEDPRPVVGPDARRRRRGRRTSRPARRSMPRAHAAARRDELEGVADEVGEDLLDPPPVAERPSASAAAGRRPARSPRSIASGCSAPVTRPPSSAIENGARSGAASPSRAGTARAGRRPGSAIDDDDPAAALEELALHGRVVDLVVEDEVEVAAQARERGAQLVGDGRHEARPLRLPRPQELAAHAPRGVAGHDRQDRRGMAEERARKAALQPVRVERRREVEAEQRRPRTGARAGDDAALPPRWRVAPAGLGAGARRSGPRRTAPRCGTTGAGGAAARCARVRGPAASSQAASASAAGVFAGLDDDRERRTGRSPSSAARRRDQGLASRRRIPPSRASASSSPARMSRLWQQPRLLVERRSAARRNATRRSPNGGGAARRGPGSSPRGDRVAGVVGHGLPEHGCGFADARRRCPGGHPPLRGCRRPKVRAAGGMVSSPVRTSPPDGQVAARPVRTGRPRVRRTTSTTSST